MYWYPLRYVSVEKDFCNNGLKVYLSEADDASVKTLRSFKSYQREQAIEFGRAVAKFEKCWFRAYNNHYAFIEIRENYSGVPYEFPTLLTGEKI